MATIYGTAARRDSSKVNGTMRVSTSWNGNEAFPRNGEYVLNLGSNPRQTIEVFVDGMSYARVYVDGNARLDIRV